MSSVLTIAGDLVGHIIGRSGSAINNIKDRSHANVTVASCAGVAHLQVEQADGDANAMVRIEGSVMNMVVAQRMVLDIVHDRE